jgi:hypothetical protein
MNWWERLRGIFRSRHEVWLEEELVREREECRKLRAENRGLTNSLLGVAGHGPMTEPVKPQTPRLMGRRSLHQVQARTERASLERIQARAAAMETAEATAGKPDAS